MTVSAPASSVVLLNNAGDPAKTAAPAGTTPSGDAASGGFQQLLAQAAGGILSIVGLAPAAPETAAAPTANAVEPIVEGGADGNTLPLLTDLLPPADAVPGVAAKAELSAEQEDDSATDDVTKTDAKDDQTLDPAETGIVLFVPPPAQTLPPAATAPATMATTTDAEAIAGAAAVGTGSTKSNGGVGGTAFKDKEFAKTGTADTAATANAADATDIGTLAIATKARGDGAAAQQNQNGQESDFDALIKQLDPAAPTNSANPVDNKVVAPASRHLPGINNAAATVSVPVAAEGWNDAVAEKVMWFSANKINSAEIHLNPPDLGPLQVRISTQQDQATVYFTSQHATVRDALDQALPRLRELMSGQGIQLTDAGVGGQSSARQHEYRGNGEGQPRSFANGFSRDGSDGAEPVAVSSVNAIRAARSAIDAYA